MEYEKFRSFCSFFLSPLFLCWFFLFVFLSFFFVCFLSLSFLLSLTFLFSTRSERQTYLNRSILGHREPNKYISIALDGMDQNKTELPYSTLNYSTLSTVWKLKTHLVGVLTHGRSPLCFLDFQQHAHDSNLSCNVLLQVHSLRHVLTDDAQNCESGSTKI